MSKEFIEAFEALASEVHATACEKGWWDSLNEVRAVLEDAGLGQVARDLIMARSIALTHCELSEIIEAQRQPCQDKHLPWLDARAVEAADAIIRLMETCHKFDLPLAEAIVAKIEYNKTRPHMHGGKRF